MNQKESVHGLACPNCGGMVPIPEGQAIVRCPYCELRSLVRGERGLRRYQVPVQVDRARAEATLAQFLSSSRAIAEGAEKTASLEESFLAYLPFWVNWARVLGWVLGEEKKGSGTMPATNLGKSRSPKT
jgi:DNA-directed RNA polymerase subunit RPC12/RpoP